MSGRPQPTSSPNAAGGFEWGRIRREATRERDAKIAADKRTLREIAADYGLTPEGVRKIKLRMADAAA